MLHVPYFLPYYAFMICRLLLAFWTCIIPYPSMEKKEIDNFTLHFHFIFPLRYNLITSNMVTHIWNMDIEIRHRWFYNEAAFTSYIYIFVFTLFYRMSFLGCSNENNWVLHDVHHRKYHSLQDLSIFISLDVSRINVILQDFITSQIFGLSAWFPIMSTLTLL